MTKHGVDDGQIIMVSSMSGHRVPPNPSTRFYAATKFAVTGLLEGWRQEVRDSGSNIRVAAISPGLVETEFQAAMYPDDPARAAAIFPLLTACSLRTWQTRCCTSLPLQSMFRYTTSLS